MVEMMAAKMGGTMDEMMGAQTVEMMVKMMAD